MLSARFHASALRVEKARRTTQARDADTRSPRCNGTGCTDWSRSAARRRWKNSSASTTTGTTTDKIDSDVNTNGVKSNTTKQDQQQQRRSTGGRDERCARVRREIWNVAKTLPERRPAERESGAAIGRQDAQCVRGHRPERIERTGFTRPRSRELSHHHANTNDEENNNNNNTGATTTTSKPAKELKWQRVAVAGEGPVPRCSASVGRLSPGGIWCAVAATTDRSVWTTGGF